MDSITSLQNLDEPPNINTDVVIVSEQEEETVPLNVQEIPYPDSTNTKSFKPETKTQIKPPQLLSSISLEVKDTKVPLKTMGVRRTNSTKREPPKMLVNRIPPAGIGKYYPQMKLLVYSLSFYIK